MPLVIDPQTGALIDSEELNRKQNQQKNLEDVNRSYVCCRNWVRHY